MTYQHVLVEREGPLTIVTINRPQSHNALNFAANRELEAVFDAFAADDEQWVAILTGAGEKAFCAGHDLKAQAAGEGLDSPPSGFAGLTSRFDLNKPVIAAVNGVAMGGGFEAVLACDIVVAAQNAVFALPEPRVGIAALAGGLQRLPQAIGMKRAMDLLLTGRRVSAQEGLDLGFVNAIADGSVLDAARAKAKDILACSPLSVQATKEAVMLGLDRPLADGMVAQWDYPAMSRLLASEDHIEGPRAFAEKRLPVWKGR